MRGEAWAGRYIKLTFLLLKRFKFSRNKRTNEQLFPLFSIYPLKYVVSSKSGVLFSPDSFDMDFLST